MVACKDFSSFRWYLTDVSVDFLSVYNFWMNDAKSEMVILIKYSFYISSEILPYRFKKRNGTIYLCFWIHGSETVFPAQEDSVST